MCAAVRDTVFTYPKQEKQKEKQTDTKLPDETTEIEKEIAYFTEEKKSDADSGPGSSRSFRRMIQKNRRKNKKRSIGKKEISGVC